MQLDMLGRSSLASNNVGRSLEQEHIGNVIVPSFFKKKGLSICWGRERPPNPTIERICFESILRLETGDTYIRCRSLKMIKINHTLKKNLYHVLCMPQKQYPIVTLTRNYKKDKEIISRTYDLELMNDLYKLEMRKYELEYRTGNCTIMT
jgi:hypothetical protein